MLDHWGTPWAFIDVKKILANINWGKKFHGGGLPPWMEHGVHLHCWHPPLILLNLSDISFHSTQNDGEQTILIQMYCFKQSWPIMVQQAFGWVMQRDNSTFQVLSPKTRKINLTYDVTFSQQGVQWVQQDWLPNYCSSELRGVRWWGKQWKHFHK